MQLKKLLTDNYNLIQTSIITCCYGLLAGTKISQSCYTSDKDAFSENGIDVGCLLRP